MKGERISVASLPFSSGMKFNRSACRQGPLLSISQLSPSVVSVICIKYFLTYVGSHHIGTFNIVVFISVSTFSECANICFKIAKNGKGSLIKELKLLQVNKLRCCTI